MIGDAVRTALSLVLGTLTLILVIASGVFLGNYLTAEYLDTAPAAVPVSGCVVGCEREV